MADIYSVLSSGYVSAGGQVPSASKYVDVDPALFEGSWKGKYADHKDFTIQVSNVTGFRAKAKYQSGAITKYQDVLIRDNGFRIGDTRFTLTKKGVAQIKTVNSSGTGQVLDTAYANQKT